MGTEGRPTIHDVRAMDERVDLREDAPKDTNTTGDDVAFGVVVVVRSSRQTFVLVLALMNTSKSYDGDDIDGCVLWRYYARDWRSF